MYATVLQRNRERLKQFQSLQDFLAYWLMTKILFRSLIESLLRKTEIHWNIYCDIAPCFFRIRLLRDTIFIEITDLFSFQIILTKKTVWLLYRAIL